MRSLRSGPLLPLVGLVPVLVLVVSGCAGSSSSETEATTTTRGGPVLTVCSDIPYEPFVYGDPSSPEGFEVDLVQAVGTDLDRPVAFRATPYDQLAATLAAGGCDLAASAIPVSDVTGEMAFSAPYLDVDMAVLVRAGDVASLGSVAALAGRPVAVVSDTPSADVFAGLAPADTSVQGFVTVDDAVDALRAGTVDAVVADAPLLDHLVRDDADTEVVVRVPTGTRYGFGVAPTNAALLAEVDQALAALAADGTLEDLTTRWFGPTA